MKTVSIKIDDRLLDIIRKRTKVTRRSIRAEIEVLIEQALKQEGK